MPRNYTNNSTNTFIDKIPLSNTCTGKWGGGERVLFGEGGT